jgi:hypothetical protein
MAWLISEVYNVIKTLLTYTVFGGTAHSDEESGITSSSIACFPVENIKEYNTKLKRLIL